jgi:hypothetical protein
MTGTDTLLSGAQSLNVYFIEFEIIFIGKCKTCAKTADQGRIRVESNQPSEVVKHALKQTEPGFGSELSTLYDICKEYE